jgi:ribosomal protein S27AE
MIEQLKLVNLKCPNCGGVLEISPDMESFACGYCGSEQIVERRGGTIGLRLVNAVARIQIGTDKTAAELALVRLDKELAYAREQWGRADYEFCLRNTPKSNVASFVGPVPIFVLLGAGVLAIGGIICLFSGSVVVGLTTIILAVPCGWGAIVVGNWATKENTIAQKRYNVQRAKVSDPHTRQIHLLETQITQARRLVQS